MISAVNVALSSWLGVIAKRSSLSLKEMLPPLVVVRRVEYSLLIIEATSSLID
jgi:hypothetical protein